MDFLCCLQLLLASTLIFDLKTRYYDKSVLTGKVNIFSTNRRINFLFLKILCCVYNSDLYSFAKLTVAIH